MIKGLFFGHTVRCEPAVGFCVRGMFEGKDLGFLYACLILLPFSAAASNFAENGIRRDAVGKVLEKFSLLYGGSRLEKGVTASKCETMSKAVSVLFSPLLSTFLLSLFFFSSIIFVPPSLINREIILL